MSEMIEDLVEKDIGDNFYSLVVNYFTNFPRRFNEVLSLFKDNLNNLSRNYPERYDEKDMEYIDTLNKLADGEIAVNMPLFKYLLDEALKLENENLYGVSRVLSELIDDIDYLMMGRRNTAFKSNDYLIFRNDVIGRVSKHTDIPLDKIGMKMFLRTLIKSMKMQGE